MADERDRLQAALSDRYTIERELGRGGMATVYLAEDLKLGRQVALKVLRPEFAALGAERFLREIRITAQLNHPHILTLLDSGETAGFVYYVMPFEAESLRDRLNREKQLPIEDAIAIARQVADALDAAHRHDIIHRDIKPENILLEDGQAYVADFGIARAISEVGGEHLTATGVAVGTPPYMSPEQAAGDRDLDARTDVYSLACVLYEMLAGQPPFTGPTAESVVRQHLTVEAPSVTNLRPTISTELAGVLTRALAKAPADRFDKAGALSRAVSVSVHTPSQTSGTRPLQQSGRAWRVGVAVAAAVLVAIGAWRIFAGPAESATSADDDATIVLVAPFTFLGSGDDEAIAAGLTEEFRTRLGGVPSLTVVARTAALHARQTGMTLQEVRDELGVDYVLDATIRIQRNGDGTTVLRVVPELTETANGSQVWATTYDRQLVDLFSVQSEMAGQVVAALGSALGELQPLALAPQYTPDPAAFQWYLRAEASFRQGWPNRPELQSAIDDYERALGADPNYALAYAKLSMAHGGLYWGNRNLTQHLELARQAYEKALRLDPDLAQGRLARGIYHYWCCRDYDRALEDIAAVVESHPNDPIALLMAAAIYKRTGRFDVAANYLHQASLVDPYDVAVIQEAGIVNLWLRRFHEAESFLARAAVLRPRAMYLARWGLAMLGRGDEIDLVREVLEANAGRLGGDYGDLVLALTIGGFIEQKALGRILCREGACSEFVGRRARPSDTALVALHNYYERRAELLYNDAPGTRTALDSAIQVVSQLATENPSSLHWHEDLSYYYALSGRNDDAVREAEEAYALSPQERDAFEGTLHKVDLALVYAAVGDADLAVPHLEALLSMPSPLSVPLLRLDPIWDPIRDDERFQALLAQHDAMRN